MMDNREQVIAVLNEILELELAGVVRYTHYSLMIFGHARIPITKWFHDEARESLDHAVQAGEYVTSLGGHPSLQIGKLLETQQHDINAILTESLEHEAEGVKKYRALLALVDGKDVRLEEYAREMIRREEDHLSEIEKMLRHPGSTAPATSALEKKQ